jgi:hypothetical protein
VGKQIGERRSTGAQRRWQIWPEELAGAEVSDEEIHRYVIVSQGKKKEVGGGVLGVFKGSPGMEEGLGFRGLGEIDGVESGHAPPGLLDGG